MKKSTQQSILALLLPFIVVIVLFGGFFYGELSNLSVNLSTMEIRGQFGDSFGVLTSLFSGLGFAGVVGTIWMQQVQIRNQESARLDELAERRSKFHLDTSAKAYSQAWALLQDHNNNRATWIRAGRLLGHARLSAEQVTQEEHKVSLEITRLEYRTFFSELLESKTPAFFFGGDHDLEIGEAAMQSSMPLEGHRLYSLPNRNIPVESLYAVWEASRWPDDYVDPLDSTFTDEERSKVKFASMGLHQYLTHREHWSSVGGKLRTKRPKTGGAA